MEKGSVHAQNTLEPGLCFEQIGIVEWRWSSAAETMEGRAVGRVDIHKGMVDVPFAMARAKANIVVTLTPESCCDHAKQYDATWLITRIRLLVSAAMAVASRYKRHKHFVASSHPIMPPVRKGYVVVMQKLLRDFPCLINRLANF